MDYRLPLILSALLINGVHGSLLVFHKTKRKWTISEHAILGKKSFLVYVIGHLLNGILFLIFARNYFLGVVSMKGIFALSVWTVAFEYIQALLPAKGKTNVPHTIAALTMWVSFLSLGLLCIAFLPVGASRKILASVTYSCILAVLVYANSHRQETYSCQMLMVLLFYAAMLVLVA